MVVSYCRAGGLDRLDKQCLHCKFPRIPMTAACSCSSNCNCVSQTVLVYLARLLSERGVPVYHKTCNLDYKTNNV